MKKPGFAPGKLGEVGGIEPPLKRVPLQRFLPQQDFQKWDFTVGIYDKATGSSYQ